MQVVSLSDSLPLLGSVAVGASLTFAFSMKEIIKAKEETIKTKDDVVKGKDEQIDLLHANLKAAEASLLAVSSKAQAVMADRILLESALNFRFSKLPGPNTRSLKIMINIFISSELVENAALRPKALQHLQDLSKSGVRAREEDLLRLFKNSVFADKLSGPHHYALNPVNGNLPNGVCIGGDEPVATALAISMLILQESGDSSYPLLLLDSGGNASCRLMSGAVEVIFLAVFFFIKY